ncbi:MAG: bifunctional (p)ppGpp synthetase/guanosine-3',5'-bis(diphosphate) 3'-pyrophosphohydrolase [Desulfobacteraceae bacterium]|nr:MAG: bifunctional (p)ppGpp synthetase/guanosine-3',5'-bis(diphosphate) 3'-pyrophosphohydrolase [Desulfobacteraceae bacterium]
MAHDHTHELLPESLIRAIYVASKAHLHQSRKSEDLPFITHPFGVGIILARAGCPEEVIVAGILHDTVEDTPLTLDDIRREFGERVASIVASSSEPDRSLPWEKRKAHTVESVKSAVLEVKMVVCADKLHNVKTIDSKKREIGEQVWERFRRGREKQEWYYRALAENLSDETEHQGYRMLLAEYRGAVERLFKTP